MESWKPYESMALDKTTFSHHRIVQTCSGLDLVSHWQNGWKIRPEYQHRSMTRPCRTLRNLAAIPHDMDSSLSLNVDRIFCSDNSATFPKPWNEADPPLRTQSSTSSRSDPSSSSKQWRSAIRWPVHVRSVLNSEYQSEDLQVIVVRLEDEDEDDNFKPVPNLIIAHRVSAA